MSDNQTPSSIIPDFEYRDEVSFTAGDDDPTGFVTPGMVNTGEAKPDLDQGELRLLPYDRLPDLVRRFRLEEVDDFPSGFTKMDAHARSSKLGSSFYECYQHDNNIFPFPVDRFKSVMRCLRPGNRYDPADYTLYRPRKPATGSAGAAAVVIVSEYVPQPWIVEHVCGGEESLIEAVGETVCTNCEPHQQFDEPVGKCPDCGAIPDSIAGTIENAREQTPGVIGIITVPCQRATPELEKDRSDEVSQAIDAYIEKTGDEYLTDQDALSGFLAEKGIGVAPADQ